MGQFKIHHRLNSILVLKISREHQSCVHFISSIFIIHSILLYIVKNAVVYFLYFIYYITLYQVFKLEVCCFFFKRKLYQRKQIIIFFLIYFWRACNSVNSSVGLLAGCPSFAWNRRNIFDSRESGACVTKCVALEASNYLYRPRLYTICKRFPPSHSFIISRRFGNPSVYL